ncbi:DUF3558 domain-containing protein [Haloechinothrix halophila]|uniref:DUF3558 domain-containing protein n=1 Tax=Haloechinothrix halophila TaxID=1069073 RepID=UPI0009FF32D9|nr:DUF3558 domain-containing protein [Haloechinothrix halophila]
MTGAKRTILATLSVVAVLLTGCSSSEAGDPDPSDNPNTVTETSDNSAGGLPHSGAPSVSQPINAEEWLPNPCSVITATQFKSIGFEDVDAEPNPDATSGPTCDWYPAEATFAGVSGAFGTADPPPEGLSRIYERHQAGEYKVWQELAPIAGHPAVRAEFEDGSDKGDCGLAVGLRDNLVYGVQVLDEKKEITDDPCGLARKIATLAVKTMKGEG